MTNINPNKQNKGGNSPEQFFKKYLQQTFRHEDDQRPFTINVEDVLTFGGGLQGLKLTDNKTAVCLSGNSVITDNKSWCVSKAIGQMMMS